MYKLAPATAKYKDLTNSIALSLCELIDTHGLDIFEIEESFGWSAAISRLNRVPVVVRLHGPYSAIAQFIDLDANEALKQNRLGREGRGIAHAHLVTAPSAAALRTVKAFYKFNYAASRVIPNPLKAAPEAETWNVNTCDSETLLFVGRFDLLKGGDLVLRAFAELAATRPQLRLTFVGPDLGIKMPEGKTFLFEQFVKSNFSKSFWPRIEFCGPLIASDVRIQRRKHFATIIASRYETFSYAVLEAMSLGCPLVATAVGGIPEVITDQRNGLLVPSQDVSAMASACQRLLDDHALAERLGRQAWQDCRDLYAPERIADQTVSAYQETIDRFRTR